jgi:hypothetical protein
MFLAFSVATIARNGHDLRPTLARMATETVVADETVEVGMLLVFVAG